MSSQAAWGEVGSGSAAGWDGVAAGSAPVSFGQRLSTALDRRGALCLGIDPHAQLLEQWGMADDLASLERFALSCVEAFADLAPVIKPQSAFFERFGSRGVAVLERTIAAARARRRAGAARRQAR